MTTLGATLPFKARLYDKAPSDGGVLVNALTVTLLVTLPDQTTTNVAVVNPPTTQGVYTANYTPTVLVGRYVGLWTFTFASGYVTKYTQVFDVDPADAGLLISLSEAKSHLRIRDSDSQYDSDILEWIAACTEIVEFYVGPCVPRTVVEYADPGWTLLLKQSPVMSIQSIIPYGWNGASFTPTDVSFQEDGVVRSKTRRFFGWGPYEVTYTAGRQVVPGSVAQAVKIILSHMWETQRGASGLPYQNQDSISPLPGLGYTIPNRALELLKAKDRGPAVG